MNRYRNENSSRKLRAAYMAQNLPQTCPVPSRKSWEESPILGGLFLGSCMVGLLFLLLI